MKLFTPDAGCTWLLTEIDPEDADIAFVRVTQLPQSKAERLALIGFTQEVFLGGDWTLWNEASREEFQAHARKHFEASV